MSARFNRWAQMAHSRLVCRLVDHHSENRLRCTIAHDESGDTQRIPGSNCWRLGEALLAIRTPAPEPQATEGCGFSSAFVDEINRRDLLSCLMGKCELLHLGPCIISTANFTAWAEELWSPHPGVLVESAPLRSFVVFTPKILFRLNGCGFCCIPIKCSIGYSPHFVNHCCRRFFPVGGKGGLKSGTLPPCPRAA